jgi:GT2 family glycosyltransferase
MNEIYPYPQVSIAIVNLNGKEFLNDCLLSIKEINYPKEKIEIIVVDNGSNDGSAQFIKSNYPEVKLIENRENLGFAKANNQAAGVAHGEYIAFLNNDTKVDKNWLMELLRPVYGSDEVICSGSKVLSLDGSSLDFVGGMINFEGKGFQIDYGLSVNKDIHNVERFLPFVNGGAMLIKRDVFLEAGGFDEDFFAYYEDVDLGWRLWVLGYKVVFSPNSIVYHAHHGTSKNFSDDKLRFLKERNSLISIFKNYDDDNLAHILSATFASIFGRIFVDFDFDYKNYYTFNLNNKENIEALSGRLESEIANVKMGLQPLSSLMAVKDFLDNISRHRQKREEIQRKRKRDDKAIFSYFKGEFLSSAQDEKYQKQQIEILKSFGIYEVFQKKIKRTVLLVSDDFINKKMAGPAIRIYNFAKVLSSYMNVIVACPNKSDLPEMEFSIIQYKDEYSLGELVNKSDIIFCGGTVFFKYKSLKRSDKYLIIDIYDPYNLATLEEYSSKPIKERIKVHDVMVTIINEELYWGDFFICASERQRDFWLGMLAALNRVNPVTYSADSTLRKLIDVVPFGLPDNKPLHTKNVLKGILEGISKDDFVIIWGGGIYNWFDPLSLIKAMSIVYEKRKDIKLFFMGIKHPNPLVKELGLVNETVQLAKSLGIYEKNVFFNFGWVPYEERQNYLLESDVGIITHPVHIETRFSFRTRVLDYIWANIPIISTEGDFFSEIIKEKELGLVVKEKDPEGIANAILKLAEDKDYYKKCVKNLSEISKDYTWENVCRPLIRYCVDPLRSAAKGDSSLIDGQEGLSEYNKLKNIKSSNKNYKESLPIKKFFTHLFKSGPQKTFKYTLNYLKGR